MRPVVRPPQYAPAPCNWRLEQPPTAFDLEVIEHVNDAGLHVPLCVRGAATYEVTRMSVMRVIELYPYTKFEVRRPSRSKDTDDFSVTALSGLVTLTFDLLTLELVRNVTRGTDNLPANFDASLTSCRVVEGEHASN